MSALTAWRAGCEITSSGGDVRSLPGVFEERSVHQNLCVRSHPELMPHLWVVEQPGDSRIRCDLAHLSAASIGVTDQLARETLRSTQHHDASLGKIGGTAGRKGGKMKRMPTIRGSLMEGLPDQIENFRQGIGHSRDCHVRGGFSPAAGPWPERMMLIEDIGTALWSRVCSLPQVLLTPSGGIPLQSLTQLPDR